MEPIGSFQVNRCHQDSEKASTDPNETIRQLRIELQMKEEKIGLLIEEGRKQRESMETLGNEAQGGMHSFAYGAENAKKSPISFREKIKREIMPTNGQESATGKGDLAELQRLRSTVKKYEEQKELLSIEKDQLEQEMKEKTAELEALKVNLKTNGIGKGEVHDQYLLSLRQFRDLTLKINSVSVSLPSADEIRDWKLRTEELSKENERVKFASAS